MMIGIDHVRWINTTDACGREMIRLKYTLGICTRKKGVFDVVFFLLC